MTAFNMMSVASKCINFLHLPHSISDSGLYLLASDQTVKSIIAARAKENQRTSTGGAKPQLIQKSGEAVRTDKELAKEAGVSHDTIHKTKIIIERADEETKQKLRTGASDLLYA
ncbi:MAG: hypothetical protein HN929_01985 [Chloroflexi bacterium]|nr:hypothetical protein [Chloroflexota bacterium]